MVVDKKWEAVRIAMLCDAPKKVSWTPNAAGNPRSVMAADVLRKTHRRGLRCGGAKRHGRIWNRMQLRCSQRSW